MSVGCGWNFEAMGTFKNGVLIGRCLLILFIKAESELVSGKLWVMGDEVRTAKGARILIWMVFGVEFVVEHGITMFVPVE